MSKLTFIKEFEKLIQDNFSLPQGQFEGLKISADEALLFVIFKGDYIKVINIDFDSNWAILKDFVKQLDEAPDVDRATMEKYIKGE